MTFILDSRNWTEYTLYYTHLLQKHLEKPNPELSPETHTGEFYLVAKQGLNLPFCHSGTKATAQLNGSSTRPLKTTHYGTHTPSTPPCTQIPSMIVPVPVVSQLDSPQMVSMLSVNTCCLHWGHVKFMYSLSQNPVFRVSVHKPSLDLKRQRKWHVLQGLRVSKCPLGKQFSLYMQVPASDGELQVCWHKTWLRDVKHEMNSFI